MSLIKWEPMREMESFFDRCARTMGMGGNGVQELMTTADWSPRVDISESENAFLIKAEVPGVKKEDVKVNLEDGVLSIQGERKQEKEEKGKRFHRIERSYGNFYRSFTLPENIDKTKIKASFNEGLLNLQIPKTKETIPHATEVKIE